MRVRAAVVQAHPGGGGEQHAREPALLEQKVRLHRRRADHGHEHQRRRAQRDGNVRRDGCRQCVERVERDGRRKDAARGHDVAFRRQLAVGALRRVERIRLARRRRGVRFGRRRRRR